MIDRLAFALLVVLTWAAICWGGYRLATALLDRLFARVRAARRRGITPPGRDWKPDWKPAPIEETRLMPGGDENQYLGPEGLGIVRPPRCTRATPSPATPFRLLPSAEQALWRDALEARP